MTSRIMLLAALIGCGTDPGPDGPELTGDAFTLQWGPVLVEPGTEGTQCMVFDVGNESTVGIHEIENTLTALSHHLIIYRDDSAPAPTSAPFPCKPFAGTLATNAVVSPIMITQKHSDLLTLPDGVAYTFAPHQRLRVEMHYLNAGDTAAEVSAQMVLRVGAPERLRDEASFLFIGTPDIELAPNRQAQVTSYFTPPESLADAKFYAITGHTHQLGTNVTVARAPSRAGAKTMIYQPERFVWSEPPMVRHDPAFTLPEGGGFELRCDYYNPTAQTVEFGESANDEMCFFWAYYYPSKGAHICVHSTLVNPPDGIDVCCPAPAGDQLSKFICDKLASDFDPASLR
jgi:Copper type II ascorbate-dependent monooxygenase, C-terminal domain